jgi:hypothetical protein
MQSRRPQEPQFTVWWPMAGLRILFWRGRRAWPRRSDQERSENGRRNCCTNGVHAPSLYRLLRALASAGIFVEQADGSFAHTRMSQVLRSDVPYSMRGLVRPTTTFASVIEAIHE